MIIFNRYFIENEVSGRTVMLIFFTSIILFVISFALAIILFRIIKKKKYLSLRDDVTKLYNFSGFCLEVNEMLKKKKSANEKYFLIVGKMNLIDIYIQTNGIDEFEKLLVILGEETKRVIKEKEIAGRISEKNFGLLLMAESKEALIERLNRINVGERMLITFRYGVYDIDSDGILATRLMIDRASYYTPKKEDSLNVEIGFYDKAKYNEMLEDRMLLSNASYAFAAKEFKAYFQPQYDTFSEKIIGAEALVRWQKDENTILSPSKFIKLFESNGLIEQLDYEMVEQSCAFIKKLKKDKLSVFPIAVNFSRAHLFDKEFVSKLLEIVNRFEISPELIEV